MIAALDTNCLLRWLIDEDSEHAMKVDAVLRNPENNIHVADLAIAEAAWVLQSFYGLTRVEIAEFITRLIANPHIYCNRALFNDVLPVYLEHKSVSFTDVCLATYVSLSDAKKLLTFDKKLARSLPLLAEEL